MKNFDIQLPPDASKRTAKLDEALGKCSDALKSFNVDGNLFTFPVSPIKFTSKIQGLLQPKIPIDTGPKTW